MNKIILFNTHIEINDYNLGDCTKLERVFSIYDKLYHRYYFKGIVYDESRRVLLVPRGLDISWLENTFGCKSVEAKSQNDFAKTEQINLKYLPRDDDQKAALRFMLGSGEYERNSYRSMLSINLNTGKGKSYCSIATIAYLSIRSIIITNSVDWLEQWRSFILEYTDIKPDEIYFISGTPSIKKLYKRDISKYKIYLSTHATIKSYGDTFGWEEVGKLFQYLKIGLKFYDEAHLNFDNMCYIDFYSDVLKTYYITASPGRSDYRENNIFALYFKNVPGIDLFDHENDPHTEYLAIKFNSHPTAMEASRCKNAYGLDRNRYTGYVVNKQNFHYLLYILIDMVKKKPGKHLIYIGTNEAILEVRNWFYEKFPELIGLVGIYTSLISKDEKRKQLENKIILSTTKSAGAAMDIKGLAEVINLAEPFKSKILAQQTLGRTRDENTLYKDIVDTGFFYTKNYYEFKKPVFLKYASKCSEVTLSDQELRERAWKVFSTEPKLKRPVHYIDSPDKKIRPVIWF